jgi:membrane-associated phospholipid phosphatase
VARLRFVLILISAGSIHSLAAQTSPGSLGAMAGDSVPAARPGRPIIRWYEGAVLAGAAGLVFVNDRAIRSRFTDNETGFRNAMADLGDQMAHGIIVFPVLAAGAIGGKIFKAPGVTGVSLRALKAATIATGAVLLTKTLVGRDRPFQSPDDPYAFSPFRIQGNAFPSGHTAIIFAVAASLSAETRDSWSDVAFYGLASITGFARMHHDKHWASDVLVGAGVGILSARFVHRFRGKVAVSPGGLGISLAF